MALQYLLAPTFQFVNTAGKPLSGGAYMEVYIHGTREKYYCASDFDGTLHPFKIPLDSLGSNIVLVAPSHSYDVYVYNRFGSLLMSRYNIVPSTNSDEAISDIVNITSTDGTVAVTASGGTDWDLSIQDTVDRVAQNEDDIGDLKTAVEGLSDQLANKKDLQSPTSFSGGATKTVRSISQNANGVLNVEFEDIDLPPEVPNVEITSEDNSVQVTETTDTQTNTKTFDLSVNVNDPLEYGQFRATNVTSQAQLNKVNGNLELNNYSIKLKKGNSYHFTVRGSYVATSAANTATTISYIEYSSFTPIQVNVDNTITDPQYFEISYDIYNLSRDMNYNVSFASISSGKLSELWVEVHNLNGVSINGSGGGGEGNGIVYITPGTTQSEVAAIVSSGKLPVMQVVAGQGYDYFYPSWIGSGLTFVHIGRSGVVVKMWDNQVGGWTDVAGYDTTLSSESTNAVQNATLYAVIGDVETLLAAL